MYNGVYTIEQYAYMHDTLMKWLKSKVYDENLGEKLAERGIKEVAVYGANDLGELVGLDIAKSSDVKLVGFIDRNIALQGKLKCGVEVVPPEKVQQFDEQCYILVVPEFYFRDILEHLMEIGVPMERIISLSMIV